MVMKVLHLIHCLLAQGFYTWAMREINPTHRDVPRIVNRQRELADKQRRLYGE
jgi:hypothetical protein